MYTQHISRVHPSRNSNVAENSDSAFVNNKLDQQCGRSHRIVIKTIFAYGIIETDDIANP